MKNSLKMEIVSDYIVVKEIAVYSQELVQDLYFLKERTAKLLEKYKKLLFKNGLFDLSFAILEKELGNNSFLVSNEEKMLQRIEEIETKFPNLVKKMKCNEFELKYLNE